MRSINSAKNLLASFGITLTVTLLGFFTRKVFIDSIGVEYLGLNGLLQNILGAMALLEGGFSTSVVYNMYKPLATSDYPKILALLQLYKKVYRYIAFGLFIFSLLLYPFLDLFIQDMEELSYVTLVYFIFVFNSLIRYFTAYKWSLVNADQKQYKLATINIVYQVGLLLIKLLILYYTRNYILYLLIESLFGIGLNIAVVKKVNQLYPYVKTRLKYEVEKETKRNIVTNMKALFLGTIGGYLSYSVDNIVLSSFIGIAIVGIYSNYTLLVNAINSLISQVINSSSESVGNLIATESKEKIYEIFKVLYMMNFLIVSVVAVVLLNTLTPFVTWWLGKDYLLDDSTVWVILVNFYINGMRFMLMTFKFKSGIFVKDRYTPIMQGIINLLLSLILVKYIGIAGVMLATVISVLCLGFWQVPYLLYKYKFECPFFQYLKFYIRYLLIMCLAAFTSYWICRSILLTNDFFQVILNGVISLVVCFFVYTLFLYKDSTIWALIKYYKIVCTGLSQTKEK